MAIGLNLLTFVLGVIAIPFWLMGAPGVDNDYAQIWKLSITALLTYTACSLLLLIVAIARKFITRKDEHSIKGRALEKLTAIAFILFVSVQIYAFGNM